MGGIYIMKKIIESIRHKPITVGLFPEMIISIFRSTVSDISEGYIVNALFDKKTASLMFED